MPTIPLIKTLQSMDASKCQEKAKHVGSALVILFLLNKIHLFQHKDLIISQQSKICMNSLKTYLLYQYKVRTK